MHEYRDVTPISRGEQFHNKLFAEQWGHVFKHYRIEAVPSGLSVKKYSSSFPFAGYPGAISTVAA